MTQVIGSPARLTLRRDLRSLVYSAIEAHLPILRAIEALGEPDYVRSVGPSIHLACQGSVE